MADLTDAQWERLSLFIPVVPRRPDGKGRPRVDNRAILNGILWVLRSGARWKDLPERYPPYQTCHRRFQEWIDQGVFERMAQKLTAVLQEQGQIDLAECFIVGSFGEAEKRGSTVGRGKDGKGSTLMLIVDANSLPIGVHVEAANRHERTQVQDTLVSVFTDEVPERLIGDKAYDSDELDADLAEQQIELIAPNRRNRKRNTQDGRPLRRAKRRWKVERAFAWL